MDHFIILSSCHCASFIALHLSHRMPNMFHKYLGSCFLYAYVYVGVLKISRPYHFLLSKALIQNLFILHAYSLKTAEWCDVQKYG